MKQLATLALAFLAPLAMGQTLTTDRASDFIDSLEEVETYSESLDEDMRTGLMDMDIVPENGIPFAPYEQAVGYLENQYPAVYEDLGEIVSEYNFDTLQDWAETGDRVAIAFIALQMEDADTSAMDKMTPEMLEQVPAQMRPQIEMVMAMLETIESAPPENIDAIRPLMDRLEQYLNMGQMNGGMGH